MRRLSPEKKRGAFPYSQKRASLFMHGEAANWLRRETPDANSAKAPFRVAAVRSFRNDQLAVDLALELVDMRNNADEL